MKILERNNITHIGAGKNLEEARKPGTFKIKGVEIAFLAYYTEIFDTVPTVEEEPTIATEDSPGVARYDPHFIKEDVEKLKSTSDYIILSMHGQDEFIHYPIPEVISEAHKIIDMGVDIIIGHGPHVLQGYEEYHNGLIFYSLSNFLFSPWFATNVGRLINYEGKGEIRRWYPESREGGILKCGLSKNRGPLNYELIPTIQKKIEPIVKIAHPKAKSRTMRRLKKWSLAYKDRNYKENYEKLMVRERRFVFPKEVVNMIDAYGLRYTFKRAKNRFLRVMK